MAEPIDRPSVLSRVVVCALLVGLILACTSQLSGDRLNARPDVGGDTSSVCTKRDDLLHLSQRTPELANAQLERWRDCDPSTEQRAIAALDRDRIFILSATATFIIASAYARRRRRWRTAGTIAASFAVLYALADGAEDLLVRDGLASGSFDALLPWAAAVKLGSFVAATPILLVAISLAIAGSPVITPEGSFLRSSWLFIRRWLRRIFAPRHGRGVDADVARLATDVKDRGLAICCSGGGIRSAAFTLGALQALDEPTSSEYKRARWVSAVSGGSYLAAAWVTARQHTADAWSRGSVEEDHLRRHASYLAPGFGGKLFALWRFLLGFGVNIGAVVLATAVVFLPYGWFIERQETTHSLSGVAIGLPKGGCLQLPDNRIAIVRPSTRALHLVDPSHIRVLGGAGIDAPPTDEDDVDGSATTPADPTCPAAAAPSDDHDHTLSKHPVDRRIDSKSTVQLPTSTRRHMYASGLSACIVERASSGACAASDARVLAPGTIGVLEGAPEVTLTSTDDAIVVERDGIFELVRACGSRACERFDLWGPLRAITLGVLAIALVLGVVRVSARTSAWAGATLDHFMKRAIGLALVGGVVLFALPALVSWAERGRWWYGDKVEELSGGGALVILLALFAQLTPFAAASETGGAAGKVAGFAKSIAAKIRPLLLRLAGAIVGPLIVASIAVAIASNGSQSGFEPAQLRTWLACLGPLAIFLAGCDLNEWSLHPFYRERLRFAFAFKRPHPTETLGEIHDHSADPLDALPVTPDLLICAAANLADDRITAPGRPVVSWVFSRWNIGSAKIRAATGRAGTISPTELAACRPLRDLAETWTAVAVSGAAFSPAMGKMTRPERFLLALGNLRLGIWYPNPNYWAPKIDDDDREIDREWYSRHHPRPWYLAKEALGLHRLRDPWIYVTDGGHYENLGLVELLRRGSKEIYCFDASGDTPDTYSTLADAARLARSELGVEIDIDPDAMKPDKDGISKIGVRAGVVTYPAGFFAPDGPKEQGWIVVAKLAVPSTAPFDVIDLARTLPSFPNHPTADQLYTDQKFEAYRALGHHLGAQAAMAGPAIRELAATKPIGAAVADVNRALEALSD